MAAAVEPTPPGGAQHVTAGVADAVGDHQRGRAVRRVAHQVAQVGRRGVGALDQLGDDPLPVHHQHLALGMGVDADGGEGVDHLGPSSEAILRSCRHEHRTMAPEVRYG